MLHTKNGLRLGKEQIVGLGGKRGCRSRGISLKYRITSAHHDPIYRSCAVNDDISTVPSGVGLLMGWNDDVGVQADQLVGKADGRSYVLASQASSKCGADSIHRGPTRGDL